MSETDATPKSCKRGHDLAVLGRSKDGHCVECRREDGRRRKRPKVEREPSDAYCECGCGQRTMLAVATNPSRGQVEGQPLRFVHGHSGSPGLCLDAEWLRQEYVVLRHDCREIAAVVGCSFSTVARALRRHGIELRRSSTTHGQSGSPAHRSWRAMRDRCERPTINSYADYGGRGITVCDRWRDFANFLADMGERPEGMTLDRIDPNGNYEPGNCRWASLQEQRANRRR